MRMKVNITRADISPEERAKRMEAIKKEVRNFHKEVRSVKNKNNNM